MSEKAAKKVPAKKKPIRKAPAKKRAAAAKKEEAKEGAVKEVVELTPAPSPIVLVRHEYEMQERVARGYSLGELASAGVSFIVAKGIGVPLDLRRRSALDGNVALLKGWYVPAPKKAKVVAAEKAEKPAKKAAKKPKKAAKAKKEQ